MSVYLFEPQNQPLLSKPGVEPVFLQRPGYETWRPWIFVPHIIIGIFLFFALTTNLWQLVMYAYTGQQTVAEITDRDVTRQNTRGGPRNEYHLTYRFLLNERPYTSRQMVSQDTYERYASANRLPVTYMKSEPYYSTITGDSTMGDSTLQLAFFTFCWSVGVIPNVYIHRKKLKQRNRLRERGILILGELVDAVQTRRAIALTVYFEIPTADEYITEKRIYVLKKGTLTDLPNDGTPIAIYYLDQKTWEVL